MEEDKKVQKILTVLFFIALISAGIYLINKNSTSNKEENSLEEKPEVTEKVEINLDKKTINLYIEQVYNENIDEITSLGSNVKRINKLLYSGVIKKSKGQVPSDLLDISIEIFLEEKGY